MSPLQPLGRSLGLATALLVALAPSAAAQKLLFQSAGQAADDWHGLAVAELGDLDGDGFGDVLVGTPGEGPGSVHYGSVSVFSPADGRTLLSVASPGTQFFGRAVASLGDVSGDGLPDFVVGAPYGSPSGQFPEGTVYVYSGADGALLYEVHGESPGDLLGSAVDGTGDLDGDGTPDFLAGAPGYGTTLWSLGRAYAFSGADGSQILAITGEDALEQSGYSIARAGDIDQDGCEDLIVGAPFNSSYGAQAGAARVYSGADGRKLYELWGSGNDRTGFSVAGGEDVDGDGVPDWLVGSPQAPLGGTVDVRSGADGSRLYLLHGYQPHFDFGTSVAFPGDVDADGYPDILGGATEGLGAGRALLFSGRTGNLQYTLIGDGEFGRAVSSAGDVNGDGRSDLLVGAPAPYAGAGEAFVFAGSTQVGNSFCGGDGAVAGCPCGNETDETQGCANSSGSGARLRALGGTSVSQDGLGFRATQLPPGRPALLFVGESSSEATPQSFGDGLKCVGTGILRLGVRTTDGGGQALWGPELGLIGQWSPGDVRYFQCWYRDPGGPCGAGFNLSDGMRVAFTL